MMKLKQKNSHQEMYWMLKACSWIEQWRQVWRLKATAWEDSCTGEAAEAASQTNCARREFARENHLCWTMRN
jgi:hypothetical protein